MIASLTLYDPFNADIIHNLTLVYPDIDYGYYKNIKNYYNDYDLCNILDNMIFDLDCTREISCGRILMTHYPMYQMKLNNYYFYLVKLQNQILYNKYLDKVIDRHIDNLIFEYYNPLKQTITKASTKIKKKNTKPNKFIKQVTNDLYTGEEIYIYENLKTGEMIESKNPNLLEELNSSKKKEKSIKVKTKPVSLDNITFSFNDFKF